MGGTSEISLVLPLGIVRIDEKTARYGPFFADNQFSPADEFVLVGLVVRKCHFDVTACAEARRLAQRAERSLRDLSALWGQPARFARRLDDDDDDDDDDD